MSMIPLTKNKEDLSKRQLNIIEKLISCSDELSCQQLHRALNDDSISIGLTTVYRNLQILQKKGFVRCRNLPSGELLYAPVERDNHHLNCLKCGYSEKIDECPISQIKISHNKSNFQTLFHTLDFFGICVNCQEDK